MSSQSESIDSNALLADALPRLPGFLAAAKLLDPAPVAPTAQ